MALPFVISFVTGTALAPASTVQKVIWFLLVFDAGRAVLAAGLWRGWSWCRKAIVLWTGLSIWGQMGNNVLQPAKLWLGAPSDANTLRFGLGMLSLMITVWKMWVVTGAPAKHYTRREVKHLTPSPSMNRPLAGGLAIVLVTVGFLSSFLLPYAFPDASIFQH